jgi:hypothetical protein
MANLEDNGASVASDNRPAFGYTLILLWFYVFIMINLAYLSSVRIMLTLVALICDLSFLPVLNLVAQFVMIYILVLIWKLPNIPTITGLEFNRLESSSLVLLLYYFNFGSCLTY